MSGRYPRITIGSIALAVALAACGKKDEPAPTQEPPKVVKVSDTEPPPPKGGRYDDAKLLVQISFTRGERGDETNALQTHVTVADDQLFFTRTPHGLPGDRINRTVTLNADEQAKVAQLARDNRLTELETIRLLKEPDAPHEYASASVKVRVDGKEHTFAIAGVTELGDAPTAFSETAALAAVVKVVGELESLINAR